MLFFPRIIGQRWKNIDPDRLSRYSEKASEDTERYKTEMQAYNGRQEAKMRSEALKPPAQYPAVGAGAGGGRGPEGFSGPGAGMDPSRGGYPEQMANMSAFANPAGGAMGAAGGYPYGGMDFGGYGAAAMYGMGGYGGYGMGAGQEAMGMRGGMEAPGGYGGGGYGAMGMMGGGFQGQMMGYG